MPISPQELSRFQKLARIVASGGLKNEKQKAYADRVFAELKAEDPEAYDLVIRGGASSAADAAALRAQPLPEAQGFFTNAFGEAHEFFSGKSPVQFIKPTSPLGQTAADILEAVPLIGTNLADPFVLSGQEQRALMDEERMKKGLKPIYEGAGDDVQQFVEVIGRNAVPALLLRRLGGHPGLALGSAFGSAITTGVPTSLTDPKERTQAGLMALNTAVNTATYGLGSGFQGLANRAIARTAANAARIPAVVTAPEALESAGAMLAREVVETGGAVDPKKLAAIGANIREILGNRAATAGPTGDAAQLLVNMAGRDTLKRAAIEEGRRAALREAATDVGAGVVSLAGQTAITGESPGIAETALAVVPGAVSGVRAAARPRLALERRSAGPGIRKADAAAEAELLQRRAARDAEAEAAAAKAKAQQQASAAEQRLAALKAAEQRGDPEAVTREAARLFLQEVEKPAEAVDSTVVDYLRKSAFPAGEGNANKDMFAKRSFETPLGTVTPVFKADGSLALSRGGKVLTAAETKATIMAAREAEALAAGATANTKAAERFRNTVYAWGQAGTLTPALETSLRQAALDALDAEIAVGANYTPARVRQIVDALAQTERTPITVRMVDGKEFTGRYAEPSGHGGKARKIEPQEFAAEDLVARIRAGDNITRDPVSVLERAITAAEKNENYSVAAVRAALNEIAAAEGMNFEVTLPDGTTLKTSRAAPQGSLMAISDPALPNVPAGDLLTAMRNGTTKELFAEIKELMDDIKERGDATPDTVVESSDAGAPGARRKIPDELARAAEAARAARPDVDDEVRRLAGEGRSIPSIAKELFPDVDDMLERNRMVRGVMEDLGLPIPGRKKTTTPEATRAPQAVPVKGSVPSERGEGAGGRPPEKSGAGDRVPNKAGRGEEGAAKRKVRKVVPPDVVPEEDEVTPPPPKPRKSSKPRLAIEKKPASPKAVVKKADTTPDKSSSKDGVPPKRKGRPDVPEGTERVDGRPDFDEQTLETIESLPEDVRPIVAALVQQAPRDARGNITMRFAEAAAQAPRKGATVEGSYRPGTRGITLYLKADDPETGRVAVEELLHDLYTTLPDDGPISKAAVDEAYTSLRRAMSNTSTIESTYPKLASKDAMRLAAILRANKIDADTLWNFLNEPQVAAKLTDIERRKIFSLTSPSEFMAYNVSRMLAGQRVSAKGALLSMSAMARFARAAYMAMRERVFGKAPDQPLDDAQFQRWAEAIRSGDVAQQQRRFVSDLGDLPAIDKAEDLFSLRMPKAQADRNSFIEDIVAAYVAPLFRNAVRAVDPGQSQSRAQAVVKNFVRKVLHGVTPGGLVGEAFRTADREKIGRLMADAMGRMSAFEDMRRLIETFPASQREAINRAASLYYQGEPAGMLPKPVRDMIDKRLRPEMAAIQKELMPLLEAAMKGGDEEASAMWNAIIGSTMGTYLHRNYKAFGIGGASWVMSRRALDPEGWKAGKQWVLANIPDTVRKAAKDSGLDLDQAADAVLQDYLLGVSNKTRDAANPFKQRKLGKGDEPIMRLLGDKSENFIEAYDFTRAKLADFTENLRMMRALAQDPEISSAVRDDAKGFTVQISKNAGFPSSMGELQGRWVTPEVASQLKDLWFARGALHRAAEAISGPFKFAQTALSPGTIGANIATNAGIVATLAGVSPFNPANAKYYREAARLAFDFVDIMGKGRAVKNPRLMELIRAGVMNDQYLPPPQESGIYSRFLGSMKTSDNPYLAMLEALKRGSSYLGGKASDIYRATDMLFRIAITLKYMDEGMTLQKAVAEMDRVTPNYRHLPLAVRNLQNVPLLTTPFVSFTLDAPRWITNAALKRPVAFALLAAMTGALAKGYISTNLLGTGDRGLNEKERAALEDIEPLFNRFERGVPKAYAMMDDGRMVYLSQGRMNALASLYGMRETAGLENFFFGSPVMKFLTQSFGLDKTLPSDAGSWERLKIAAENASKSYIPPPFPGGRDYERLADAIAGRASKTGRVQDPEYALLGLSTGYRPAFFTWDIAAEENMSSISGSVRTRLREIDRTLDAAQLTPKDMLSVLRDLDRMEPEYAERIAALDKAITVASRTFPKSVSAKKAENLASYRKSRDGVLASFRAKRDKVLGELRKADPEAYREYIRRSRKRP